MEIFHGLHGFSQGFVLVYVQTPDHVFVSVPVKLFTFSSARECSLWLCYGGRWSWVFLVFAVCHGDVIIRVKLVRHATLKGVLEWCFEGG